MGWLQFCSKVSVNRLILI